MAMLTHSRAASVCGGAHQTRPLRVPAQLPRLQQRRVAAQATTDSKSEKKVLKREEEPEEYWVSKGERKGANPMSDPLAIIGVTAILFPFVLLGIAVATGLVDLSVYR